MTKAIGRSDILILDLDDTIFQTSSLPRRLIAPVFEQLKNHLKKDALSEAQYEQLITDLWRQPIDVVFRKYDITTRVIDQFYRSVEDIEIQKKDIQVFDDFAIIKAMSQIKYLVTTGITSFQLQKIQALDIESDFKEIYVDDPRSNPRIGKKGIFQKIIANESVSADEVWIIGDNPDSELIAGYELGCNTIQKESPTKSHSIQTNFLIQSFKELVDITS